MHPFSLGWKLLKEDENRGFIEGIETMEGRHYSPIHLAQKYSKSTKIPIVYDAK